MLIAVLFGSPINGTRRWFGIAGFGIQPSEFAKIAVIIFTAAILERRMDRVNELSYSLLPIGLVTGGIAGLVLLGPDFSTAFTMFVIVGAIVFSAGLSYRYLIGLTLVFIPTIYFVIATSNYRRRRFLGFLDPWADPLGDGYQIMQSLIAVGTGGLFGKGLMGGVQKLFYLPEPHTDFIYAVIAEETGLVGATLVLLCFGMIIWRGLRVTLRAPDRFGAFLAVGITTMVASQAFMNISVVLSLMPTTGLPLPFLSSGGSSLLVSSIAMGVLLNISQHASVET
jgi:cell division protein FtsW